MFCRFIKILPFFLFLFSSSVFAEDLVQPYREGELLVKFRPHVISARRQSAHKAVSALTKKRFRSIRVDQIDIPSVLSVKEALKIYRENPDVEYAEPNFIVRKATIPDDQYFNLQWGFNNTGQTIAGDEGTITGTSGVDIGAPDAWDITTGSSAIVIAVIDSGVDYNHPDLAANIWSNKNEIPSNGIDDDGNGFIDDIRGWNFVSDNNNPMDTDVEGHGTHVAGAVGAVGNNSAGISGVNWNIQIMPLKFLDSQGNGSIANVISAIEYAVKMGAKIINASYTYPQLCFALSPDQVSLAERDAIKAAGDAGILFVAAAGNAGCNNDNTPFYPASHDLPFTDAQGSIHPALQNIMSVAAFDQKGKLPSFSNYGLNSVHLAAPGVNIFSTIRTDLTGKASNLKGYGYLTGTSMASPLVAGAAGLIWSKNPAYTYADVMNALLSSVVPDHVFSGKTISGGRLNVFSALTGIPARPTGLSALSVSRSGIRLSWDDNSNLEDGFHIERKSDTDLDFSLLATVGPDIISYLDTAVTKGVTYNYRTRAFNSKGESPYSDEASAIGPGHLLKTLNISVIRNGRVTSNPSGIDCPGTCSNEYNPGTSVILTETPADGSKFVKWTGACTGTSTSCTVTMDKRRSVTAIFRKLRNFIFTVRTQKGGTVTSNDGNINCVTTTTGKICRGAAKYLEDAGTTVTLTASPADKFSEWVGCTADPATPQQCSITMDSSKTVTAKFLK